MIETGVVAAAGDWSVLTGVLLLAAMVVGFVLAARNDRRGKK